MATIKPFRGIRYNQSKVSISNVVAPPYDVISPEQQDRLYTKDPYNIIRLILGKEKDPYSAASTTFTEWQKTKILQRDIQPSLYLLVQTFKTIDGTTTQRKGFIALCKLEEFEKGIILPHEKTLSKAKEDRFKLFKATNSNFSQIFCLYSDPQKNIDITIDSFYTNSSLIIDVTFEDIHNQVWLLSDIQAIETIATEMQTKQVLIADGHHRYETALAYRNLMKSQNPNHTGTELYNYVMMFFTNLDDEGLVIFPTHRVIHSLPVFEWKNLLTTLQQHFEIQTYPTPQLMMNALHTQEQYAYGIISKESLKSSEFLVATLKNKKLLDELIGTSLPHEVKQLDVILLHSYILGKLLNISSEAQEKKLNIHYIQKVEECIDEIAKGHSQIALFVNPTKIEQVRAVANAGYTMPQKSTFFYPKLLSGLVLNLMDE